MADSPPSAQLARIDTAETLTSWLASLGLTGAEVVSRQLDVPLTADAAWDLAVGNSGMRALITGLTPATVERIRARFADRLAQASVTDLDARILTGTAVR